MARNPAPFSLLLPFIFLAPKQSSAQTFIEVGQMNTTRLHGQLVELADGRVLVCGGIDPVSIVELASAEMYDPATQQWTAVAPMNYARNGHTATLLADGRVFVFGGYAGGTPPNWPEQKVGEIYDPALNTWTFTSATDVVGSNGIGRTGASALLIGTDVLIIGGGSNVCEWYDPAADAFTFASQMNLARDRMGVERSGDFVIAAGSNTTNADRIEVLDLTTSDWSLVAATLNVDRERPAVLHDGSDGFWIAGGQDGNLPSVVEHFHRPSGVISSGAAAPVIDHTFDSYVLCASGDITGFGGADPLSWFGDGDTETLEVYDTAGDGWSTTQDYGATVPAMASHVRLSNGNVLTAGGVLLIGPILETFTMRSFLIDPCGTSLGLEETGAPVFTMFPDPANGSSVSLTLSSPSIIDVLDAQGRSVFHMNARSGIHELPTGAWENGAYLVRAQQRGVSSVVRLVVAH